ncbi:N-acetylmuramoyl-L-alanine amidase [Paenibacillus sp. YIM B09110]|uniref:N-acetylmuramoyl-L-alanine amidase n=1 Tax=Paenibacillus sp. YIM B09110 TaxID=3126102 RepID=UPI00301BBF05
MTTVTKIRAYNTDIRYVVLPAAEYVISAVGRTNAKPSVLAREAGADVAINFPFFGAGALYGYNVVSGNVANTEIPKTAARSEFYGISGKYAIGDAERRVVDFAVQGSPALLRNGAVVFAESVANDQTGADIVTGRAQRTAIGIHANGDVVFVISDGRTVANVGLTLTELATVMRDQLACVDAINGDGGGSSMLYVDGAIVNNVDERATGCALIAKKKETKVTNMKIVIDAGHGLQTAGKRCPDDSMREFAFNSVVARYVRDTLAEYEGVTVKFSHDDTGAVDVALADRVKIANDWNADVFVSIHANAAGDGWSTAAGIETYTSNGASATSGKMAAAVQKRLIAQTARKDRGVKREDFYVIAKTKMPAILVEAGFMTNAEEASLLKTGAYRKKCAAAIVEGLAEVFALKRKVVAPTPSTNAVTVIVNGKKLAEGRLENGVTYVDNLPVRALAEVIGASVAWDGVTRTVTITK